jgi:hypothetical protein
MLPQSSLAATPVVAMRTVPAAAAAAPAERMRALVVRLT